jgi:crotonobetaine/carnitine-CoA ligase
LKGEGEEMVRHGQISQEWHVAKIVSCLAKRFPDKTFIRMVDGPSCSFGAFSHDTLWISSGLESLGVGPLEHVAIMGRNSIEFLKVFVAITRLRAAVVPVNLAYTGRFLEHILNNSGAKLLIAEPDFIPVIRASAANLQHLKTIVLMPGREKGMENCFLRGIDVVQLSETFDGAADHIDCAGVIRDPAALMFTSGTTGASKGVVQTHGHIVLEGKVFAEQMRLTSDDVIYCCLPMFHSNALALHFSAAIQLGCELVLDDRFHATRWVETVRRYNVTQTNLLGVMTDFVWRQPEDPRDADNSLRVISCVPIPPTMGPAFEKRFGVRLVELYGTTECNVPIYMPYDDGIRPGAAGRVIEDWFEVRIADPETDEDVPPGATGEILVRPKVPWCFMAGYYGDAEATVSAWRNFWFHTGDAGKMDTEGYFYFVDRIRDCLRRRGENISSFEVEAAIFEHPCVKEVAVVGVDSGIEGGEQEVLACVVLNSNGQLREKERLLEELFEHCERLVPKFAAPRFIRFLEELPKTPTEKIRKSVLREEGLGEGTFERGSPKNVR